MNIFCKLYEVGSFQVLVEKIIDDEDKPAILFRWHPEDGLIKSTDYKISFNSLQARNVVFHNMNLTFIRLMIEKCQHHIDLLNGGSTTLNDINVGWMGFDPAQVSEDK
ncbi:MULTISPECIES: hypothetical protein [Citrobacter]|uniref:hypothetical protein n=1 Tax=Citrobacter TaxID=544 RepID=UPI002058DCF1|nr:MULTISPECIES: hypothetical protein [Citrobacter]MDE8798512.1 hypothetical protein [Citrobacter freundii]MDE8803610.1 hypothetical protein [Citrobacter freundii]DAO21203.1 MAG TPA: hypothetical protein [Caudoviricetes sp.]HCL5399597.1 hypothetical protein [Citrobacter freundii]